jgi:hypothetical protein
VFRVCLWSVCFLCVCVPVGMFLVGVSPVSLHSHDTTGIVPTIDPRRPILHSGGFYLMWPQQLSWYQHFCDGRGTGGVVQRVS